MAFISGRYLDFDYKPTTNGVLVYNYKNDKNSLVNIKSYNELLDRLLRYLEKGNTYNLDYNYIIKLVDDGYVNLEQKVSHRLTKVVIKIRSFLNKKYKTDYNLKHIEKKYIELKKLLISQAIDKGDIETCKVYVENIATGAFDLLAWAKQKADEQESYAQVIELLLKYHQVDFEDQTFDVNSLINWAVQRKYTNIFNLLLLTEHLRPDMTVNQALMEAAKNGHAGIVKLLIQDWRIDPTIDGWTAMELATMNQHTEVVEVLLQDSRFNPAIYNRALRMAAGNGFVDIVKLLLKDPRVDPTASNNHALKWAAKSGYVEVVKLLLNDTHINPSAERNLALKEAMRGGHVEVVKLLLLDKRLVLTIEYNEVTKWATRHGYTEVIKLLSLKYTH